MTSPYSGFDGENCTSRVFESKVGLSWISVCLLGILGQPYTCGLLTTLEADVCEPAASATSQIASSSSSESSKSSSLEEPGGSSRTPPSSSEDLRLSIFVHLRDCAISYASLMVSSSTNDDERLIFSSADVFASIFGG